MRCGHTERRCAVAYSAVLLSSGINIGFLLVVFCTVCHWEKGDGHITVAKYCTVYSILIYLGKLFSELWMLVVCSWSMSVSWRMWSMPEADMWSLMCVQTLRKILSSHNYSLYQDEHALHFRSTVTDLKYIIIQYINFSLLSYYTTRDKLYTTEIHTVKGWLPNTSTCGLLAEFTVNASTTAYHTYKATLDAKILTKSCIYIANPWLCGPFYESAINICQQATCLHARE